jgi:pyridoxal 5'-phosphate synthase pdxT subunit
VDNDRTARHDPMVQDSARPGLGSGVKVGVLALQGASARHAAMLARLGAEPVPVRTPAELAGVEALVLPGGESTTISMLLESSGLFDPVAERLAGGMPALGTCAGMILLGREILDGRPDQRCFGALDIAVQRNAFGRQVDSFEADLAVDDISGVEGPPLHAVFIRAPVVERVADEVEVLAAVDGRPVLCRQGPVLAAAFHPELGDDPRLHELFLTEVV